MKKSLIIFSAIAVLASSCNSMLDITPPNSLTDEQVMDIFENGTPAQKEAIVKGIVNAMPKYFNLNDASSYGCSTGAANTMRYSYEGIEWGRALMGADIVSGYNLEANDLAGKKFYRYDGDFRGSSAENNYCYWAMYAASIQQANIALGWVTEEKAKQGNIFKDGRARALLVRAFSYMCMMEEYQDAYLKGGKDKLGLPLYTEYNPLQETVERSSAEQTWAFIKKDITDAISYLTEAGVGYTAGRDAAEDFDLGVANFLYARASLLTGDYASCIKACKSIIESGAYSLIKAENWGGRNTGAWTPTTAIKVLPNTNAFTSMACNPETILGFKKTSGFYQSASDHFNLANAFGNYTQQGNVPRIDETLYNKISDKDVRKQAFYPNEIGDYKFSNNNIGRLPSYINLKFSATEGLADNGTEPSGKATEYAKLDYTKFRLAEVYLMKAEAEAETGSADAKATINALLAARSADPANVLSADDYAGSIKDVIKLQWRIEMWGEGGREWYNAKRWGDDIVRSSQMHKDAGSLISAWPATKMTLHVPMREIQTNNKCEDNSINE